MKSSLGIRKRIALELFARERKQLAMQHDLKVLFWECTLRCNLNCRHCGSDCRAAADVEDMPAEDFLRAIESITPHVNPNEVLIAITGGEALIRRDLEQVGAELTRRGFRWGIVTNGMLLDRQRMTSLCNAGLRSITLSMDGFAEQHNAIRRNPHSFDRALQALRIIVRQGGINYDVVTCVSPDNFQQLSAFKEFLIAEGCRAWRIFTIFPVGRAADDQQLQLSPAQYRELMDFIVATRREGRIRLSYGCEGFLGSYEAEVRDNFFGCMAGVGIAGIRIDGAISGCTSIRARFDEGNIYTDDLWEVWNSRFERYRNRAWARKGRCADCRMWRYCEGNGMHLYDDNEQLIHCNLERLCSD